MARIVCKDVLNPHYTAITVETPALASEVAPGQILRARTAADGPLLPYPVAGIDAAKGTVTFVVRTAPSGAHGADTARVGQSPVAARSGDPGASGGPNDVDVEGPFGRVGAVNGAAKILCVAEGLGVAALIPRLEAYKAADVYTVVVATFASKEHMFWLDRLDALSDELYTVTEDGSFGIKGPARDTVKGICQHVTDIDRAIVIGPLKLLKKCCHVTGLFGIPTLVSLAAVAGEEAAEPAHGADGTEGDGVATTDDGAVESRMETLLRFDWSAASDRDGHKTDFDAIARTLGLQTIR